VFDIFSDTEAADWKLAGFLDACYPPAFEGDEIPNDIVGKHLSLRVFTDTYQGKENKRARDYKPAAKWKGVNITVGKDGKVEPTGPSTSPSGSVSI
jgi:hypothetical protein